MKDIIDDVSRFAAKYFNVREIDLYSKCRRDDCVTARHIIWYYLHYEHNVPASVLAREFFRGRRNVFLALNKIKNGIETQKYYKGIYANFTDAYKSKKATS